MSQIDNLVKSGQVDIDERTGFNGLIPYVDFKAEQNTENLLFGPQTQSQTTP